MTLPNPHTSDVQGPQKWTTTTHEYMFMYTTAASEGIVGRRPIGNGAFTTFQIAGAARTALALGTPITDDHNFPTIAVHGHNGVDETADVVHVFANMHDDPLRYIKSTAGSITSWSSADLPDEQVRNSYPVVRRVETVAFSGLWLYLRAGPENTPTTGDNRSGAGDSRSWRLADGETTWESLGVLFQGYSVPGAGPGDTVGQDLTHDTDTNWSAYIAGPEVEGPGGAHPGRMHMAWLWRVGVPNPSRTVIDGVCTNADPTITSATLALTAADVGMEVIGQPGVPTPAYVGAVNSATSFELSSSATANVPLNANLNSSAVRVTIGRNRSPLNATTLGDPTVTVAATTLAAADVGVAVYGSGIPRPAWIGEVTDASHFELSSSPDSHVPLNADETVPLGGITIGQPIGQNNIDLSYGYSDDGGETWQALDGTVLDLPVHRYNNPECLTGISGDPEGFVNAGGVCMEPDGTPHLVIGRNPHSHVTPVNGVWTETVYGDGVAGLTLDGVAVLGRINPFWFRDALWFLTNGGPSGARRPRLFKADGSTSICLGGVVSADGSWECNADPEAYRLFGRIEVLTPDVDTPKTFQYGNKPRVRVA